MAKDMPKELYNIMGDLEYHGYVTLNCPECGGNCYVEEDAETTRCQQCNKLFDVSDFLRFDSIMALKRYFRLYIEEILMT